MSEYPPDMVERCAPVASLMRRGTPWQHVALVLFARRVALPEETIRNAFRWAYDYEIGEGSDELDVAEEVVTELLRTRAGRRLERVIARHVKQSGLASKESSVAIARSVLTNAMMVPLGGEISNQDAVVEVLAGFGAPIQELSKTELCEAAQLIDALLAPCSFGELKASINSMSVAQLTEALSECELAYSLLPIDLRNAIPSHLLEVLTALLAPFIVHLRKKVEELTLEYDGTAMPGVPMSHVSERVDSVYRPPLAPRKPSRSRPASLQGAPP